MASVCFRGFPAKSTQSTCGQLAGFCLDPAASSASSWFSQNATCTEVWSMGTIERFGSRCGRNGASFVAEHHEKYIELSYNIHIYNLYHTIIDIYIYIRQLLRVLRISWPYLFLQSFVFWFFFAFLHGVWGPHPLPRANFSTKKHNVLQPLLEKLWFVIQTSK